jgi:hypothetical protein
MEPRTERRARRAAAGIAAALLALAVLASAAVASTPRERSWTLTAPPQDRLTLQGRIDHLYPGYVGTLRIRVRNTGSSAIILTRIRTTVGDAAPGCVSQNLHVRRFRGALRVPAHGMVRVQVRVRLSERAPDACQGVRFPLAYSGRGVAA